MTEYRLTEAGRAGLQALLAADALGTAAYVGRKPFGYRAPGSTVDVDLPEGWIEPVPPPLPPEPEPGPWLIGNVVAVRLAHDNSAQRWFVPDLIGADYTVSWETLWREYGGGEGVQIRRLVPVPDLADETPNDGDRHVARREARIHGFAGGTEVNTVSFQAGFVAGLRRGRVERALVPAPEPVTPPWRGESDLGRELIVAIPVPESRYRLVPLAVAGTATTVAPETARAMAAALLSAADQAEAVDRG